MRCEPELSIDGNPCSAREPRRRSRALEIVVFVVEIFVVLFLKFVVVVIHLEIVFVEIEVVLFLVVQVVDSFFLVRFFFVVLESAAGDRRFVPIIEPQIFPRHGPPYGYRPAIRSTASRVVMSCFPSTGSDVSDELAVRRVSRAKRRDWRDGTPEQRAVYKRVPGGQLGIGPRLQRALTALFRRPTVP